MCVLCRTPRSDEEIIKRLEKLMEKGDARAVNKLASYYDNGTYGLPQDMTKANELRKAGELGSAYAYNNYLGNAHNVERVWKLI